MTYTNEKLERIRIAEFNAFQRHLALLTSAQSQLEVDQHLFGIINHITTFTCAYHNSKRYKNLPRKPGDKND